MIFKNSELERFFCSIKKLNETKLFREWKGEKCFLIRHDIDFDLQLAHDMATLQNKLGIKATYFILTSCEYYNILSKNSRSILKSITKMGHEVALHFDPTLYKKNMKEGFLKEIEILSTAIESNVKSVSLHNPTSHGQYPLFDGFVNAYDPNLFSDSNYISDSCFSFRGKNPFEFIKGIDKNMIQILLHPLHYTTSGAGYDKIMVNSFERRMMEADQEFSPVNKVFKKQVGNSLVDLFRRS